MRKKSGEARRSRVVALLDNHFSDWKGQFEWGFQRDENFQSLCRDYYACARALEAWKASDSENAPKRRQEYAELLAELEQEVRDWLENSNVVRSKVH